MVVILVEKYLKAIEIENAINKFAGIDNNLISADDLLVSFRPTLYKGLNGLKLRSLITEKEETELNNTCFNCNDNLKFALDDLNNIDSINHLIKRLKELSIKFMEEIKDEE